MVLLLLQIFLLAHEPLESSPVRADGLVGDMRKTREAYKALLLEKMRAPDGSYDTDLVLPDTTTPTSAANGERSPNIAQSGFSDSAGRAVNTRGHRQSKSSLEFNNPLSLHNEVELRVVQHDLVELIDVLEPVERMVRVRGFTKDDFTGCRAHVGVITSPFIF